MCIITSYADTGAYGVRIDNDDRVQQHVYRDAASDKQVNFSATTTASKSTDSI